jgi:hypothetical protein
MPVSPDLVVANVERAGDHAAIVGVLALVAAVGGAAYGLVRLVARSRASRTRPERGPKPHRGPEA